MRVAENLIIIWALRLSFQQKYKVGWQKLKDTSLILLQYGEHPLLQRLPETLVWLCWCSVAKPTPDSKIHGANMEPPWVLSAPDGPHVGPMNLAILDLKLGVVACSLRWTSQLLGSNGWWCCWTAINIYGTYWYLQHCFCSWGHNGPMNWTFGGHFTKTDGLLFSLQNFINPMQLISFSISYIQFLFPRCQAIIWTNDGKFTDAYMHKSASINWNPTMISNR